MRQQTGCDGVMIGRAAMGNPWIFSQILALEKGMDPRPPELGERREVITAHFSLLIDLMGEERAAKIMRGLLLRYTRGLPYSSRFRGVFTGIRDLNTMIAAMDTYFSFLTGISASQTEAPFAESDQGDDRSHILVYPGPTEEHNGT
jgi:tRNA-dihydrouridine synthase B